ncbi:DUF3861 domain-containing protein [Vibrio maerlii]|uniref:DUF3861 domain-containing protein n=1 Tax=Vibrio maerlii TaxID=2231648 RepID=UPI001F133E7A|nr:DUF3861 domain-containing protein [Vibrio maerlii]
MIVEEVGVDAPKTLEFDYQDREDLFNVVENLKKGSGLEPETATKVAVALRLLGPVMMKDRKHPLFVDFMPHFKKFMQNLKSTVKQAAKSA